MVPDNFEWTQGFSQRFGMIYVDDKTQKRILRDSAARYTQIIRSQGAIL
jgi:beta-glucosidase